MSPLERGNTTYASGKQKDFIHIFELADVMQKDLRQKSISPELLERVKDYLKKIDLLFPKGYKRDFATDEFLWGEGDDKRGVAICKVLGMISDHPDLGNRECDERDSVIQIKAIRLIVTITLCVPGVYEEIKKTNESA
ncbi:hypothetical protein KKA33_03575 [Patescibacteria group bacterium]|nr:hypothetical protein [Patescibacteria group bacterium]